MADRRQPRATYRVQLHPGFGFADTAGILGHLSELGISHLYLSPIGRASAGSTHGYDWLPPPEVAPALGGLDGLRELRGAANAVDIGLIIDIVPNHTGVADAMANPWFADVLRHGRHSDYSSYFDIDFSTGNGADGAIALPVLAADGDLSPLEIDDDELRYFEHHFPIAPGTLGGTPTDVHDRQHYRLVPWNSGLIGYRRFFTVNELAGLCQEDPKVYAATHAWLRELIAEDLIDGVRVDHPDGLWDPQGYLRRLRADVGRDRLIYVEKILASDEPLEPTLPVEGTTGYEQMRIIDALFVAPSGVIELAEIHERVTGVPGDSRWIETTEHERKLVTLTESFPTEHRRLVNTLTHSDPDADEPAVAHATAELIAGLGVYRADYPTLRLRLVEAAASIARRRPALADALALVVAQTASPGAAASRLAQTCGAVTAKSVEDSLFYRTARLVSAQEVGGDPAHPAMSLDTFHEHNATRAAEWPLAMTASSTHDTKRGEDVRARIAMLAQIPERWSLVVDRIWRTTAIPDDLTCYFLLQNIVGVWPIGAPVSAALRGRLHEYARKAMREAGLRTTWTEVDDDFESAVLDWIDAVTADPVAGVITELVARIADSWEQEALARKAIAILGPGVPDIYQGTEWWDDSLVDPDNRRPVDFTRGMDHPKAALVRAALSLRAAHPAAFGTHGTYRRLNADGPAADHAVAFARGDGRSATVVVVTARFTHSLRADSARATAVVLPPGRWRNVLTAETHSGTVDLATLRATHPVAMLEVAPTSNAP